MKGTIDPLLEQPIGLMAGYFSVAVVELIVFLSCFELVTKYRCWHEIKRGNMAASLATGAKSSEFAIFCVLRPNVHPFMSLSGGLLSERFCFSLLI